MKQATLKIRRDGTTYSYGNAQVEEGAVAAFQQMSDAEIEKGHINVQLYSNELVGITDPYSLPDEYMRCELSLDDEVILNGALHRVGVATDDGIGGLYRWTLRLEDQAIEDFVQRLEDVTLPDLAGALHDANKYITLDTVIDDNGTTTTKSLRWYAAETIWTELLSEINAIEGATTSWFLLEIPYDPGTGEKVFTRDLAGYLLDARNTDSTEDVPHTLPEWSGYKFLQVMRQMLGFRFDAEYSSFPGTGLTVDIYGGRWKDADGLPTLGTGENGIDRSTDWAESPDFALVFANGPADSSSYTGPAAPSLYASNRWAVDDEGEPENESVETIPVHHPPFTNLTSSTFSDGDYEETQRTGNTVVEQAAEKVYITAVSVDALYDREPTDGTSEIIKYNETWAKNLFGTHVLANAQLHHLLGDFDTQGLAADALQAGRYDKGISYDGRSWLINRINRQMEGQEESRIGLVRPVDDYDPSAAAPDTGPPVDVRGQVVEPFTEQQVRWWWQPPIQVAEPRQYEVETSRDGKSWTNEGYRTTTVYTQDLTFTPTGGETFYLRVRSVYDWKATPSEWVVGSTTA